MQSREGGLDLFQAGAVIQPEQPIHAFALPAELARQIGAGPTGGPLPGLWGGAETQAQRRDQARLPTPLGHRAGDWPTAKPINRVRRTAAAGCAGSILAYFQPNT
jgi:hypothetical protein